MKAYKIKPVPNSLCKEWILRKHYAKRMPPVEYAFGLFDEIGSMQGCVTFGTPVSSNLRELWNGEYKLMELNRLVVNDGLEKNTLSYFVSQSMKMIPKPIVVVSYADTSQKHHGYIYQATNFYYTGLSADRTDWNIDGVDGLHGATIADMSRGKVNRAKYMREKYGDKFSLKPRPRKHRYFIFLGNKRDKKRMLKMLPYKIEPYPKGDNIRYDSSYQPTVQTQMF